MFFGWSTTELAVGGSRLDVGLLTGSAKIVLYVDPTLSSYSVEFNVRRRRFTRGVIICRAEDGTLTLLANGKLYGSMADLRRSIVRMVGVDAFSRIRTRPALYDLPDLKRRNILRFSDHPNTIIHVTVPEDFYYAP